MTDFPGFFANRAMAGGVRYYRATTNVEANGHFAVLEVSYLGAETVQPEIRWPVPGVVVELVLVTDYGRLLALTSQDLRAAPPVSPEVLPVTAAPGVWTELPDAGIKIFHKSGATLHLTVTDGQVEGFNGVYGLLVETMTDRELGYDDPSERDF